MLLHRLVLSIKKCGVLENYWEGQRLCGQLFSLLPHIKDEGARLYLAKILPVLVQRLRVVFSASWMPDKSELDYVVGTRLRVVEVGAGDGTVARVFQDRGLTVMATDIFPVPDLVTATMQEFLETTRDSGDVISALAGALVMKQQGFLAGENVESRQRRRR